MAVGCLPPLLHSLSIPYSLSFLLAAALQQLPCPCLCPSPSPNHDPHPQISHIPLDAIASGRGPGRCVCPEDSLDTARGGRTRAEGSRRSCSSQIDDFQSVELVRHGPRQEEVRLPTVCYATLRLALFVYLVCYFIILYS